MRLTAFLPGLALLGALVVFSSSPAKAATGCDCGTMSSLLRSAAQTVVTGVVNPIVLAIEKAAGYQALMNREDLTAVREAILMAQEKTVEAITLAELSEADRLTERTYEPASQPPTNCLNDEMGEAWRNASIAKTAIREGLMDSVAQRSAKNAKPADYLKEIASGSLKTGDLARLLGTAPESLTLTLDEFSQAGEALGQLTDPLPAPNLPAQAASQPAGLLYAAAKSVLEKRLAIYQGVLAQRLANRAPTIEGVSGWATRKWAEMGGTGSPPGLVEGKMSEDSLTWLIANLRLGSASWHEKTLPALPEAGLLRELAVMAAAQLELSRRQNQALENVAFMLALDGIDRLDQRTRPALRNQYRLALGGR